MKAYRGVLVQLLVGVGVLFICTASVLAQATFGTITGRASRSGP